MQNGVTQKSLSRCCSTKIGCFTTVTAQSSSTEQTKIFIVHMPAEDVESCWPKLQHQSQQFQSLLAQCSRPGSGHVITLLQPAHTLPLHRQKATVVALLFMMLKVFIALLTFAVFVRTSIICAGRHVTDHLWLKGSRQRVIIVPTFLIVELTVSLLLYPPPRLCLLHQPIICFSFRWRSRRHKPHPVCCLLTAPHIFVVFVAFVDDVVPFILIPASLHLSWPIGIRRAFCCHQHPAIRTSRRILAQFGFASSLRKQGRRSSAFSAYFHYYWKSNSSRSA